MNYDVFENGDQIEAKLNGDLNFSDHDVFRTLLDRIRNSDLKKVVLNLREVSSIDSTGIGRLLIANDRTKAKGQSLAISNANGQVRKVLDLSSLGDVITIVD